eukprot:scaffold48_cov311-Pinguiococcus_pyrenoidosus.AAC.105
MCGRVSTGFHETLGPPLRLRGLGRGQDQRIRTPAPQTRAANFGRRQFAVAGRPLSTGGRSEGERPGHHTKRTLKPTHSPLGPMAATCQAENYPDSYRLETLRRVAC